MNPESFKVFSPSIPVYGENEYHDPLAHLNGVESNSVAEENAEDVYADRMDVAGVEESPRVFFLPFWKKFDVVHPKVNTDVGTRSVIVLDLDEVATALVGSSSGDAAVAESLLLGGAGFLALWYGTRTSIQEIIETTKELSELSSEKKELLLAACEACQAEMSDEAFKRLQTNLNAMMVENRDNRHSAKVHRVFSGVVSGVGATAVGAGTFMSVPLYTTTSVAAAGAVVLSVAAPIISLFAAGVAGQQAYRFYKTRPILKRLASLTTLSMRKGEPEAFALLKKRIQTVQRISAVRSASMLCMAVGAPLTVFGGPYGLAVLLPGVVTSIVASYLDTRKLGYTPQLTWEEKARIDGRDALVNAIGAAHNEYAQLKKMKNEHRLLYPVGAQAPLPFRLGAKAVAWVRRRMKDDLTFPRAEHTFLKYLAEHNSLEMRTMQNTSETLEQEYQELMAQIPPHGERTEDQTLRESEIVAKRTSLSNELEDIALEDRLLKKSLDQPLLPCESVFCLLRFMIRNKMFPNLSGNIIKDKKLRRALSDLGVVTKNGNEYHLDANKLVLVLLDENLLSLAERGKLAEKLFEKGRDTLLTTAKNRAQWKERQLLDFLAVQLVKTS